MKNMNAPFKILFINFSSEAYLQVTLNIYEIFGL